jgi:hypothetical protein
VNALSEQVELCVEFVEQLTQLLEVGTALVIDKMHDLISDVMDVGYEIHDCFLY